MTIDREKLEAHITGLRALHSWMMTNDIDMQCPDEVQDPEDTAGIMAALLAELDALRAENAIKDCLHDSAYKAGVKAGWNYCAKEDHEGYANAMRSTEHIAEIKRLRASIQQKDKDDE